MRRLSIGLWLVAVAVGCGNNSPTPTPCTADSQCSGGDYCDFGSTSQCPDSVVSAINPGICVPNCGSSCPQTCTSNEDCAEAAICLVQNGSGESTTCSGGGCVGTCSSIPCPGPGALAESCPSGCSVVAVPHSCTSVCVCPSNTCKAP